MVNWKKFFVENDDETIKDNNVESKENTKSKLQRWFEEDFNEKDNTDSFEDDFDIEFFDDESENKNISKVNKVQKTSSKNLMEEELEDSNEDDIFDDYDDNEDEKVGLFSKFKALFKDKNKNNNDSYDEDFYEDDEPEDYKTYLERQKNEQLKNKQEFKKDNKIEKVSNDELDFDIEFTDEADIFEEEFEDKDNTSFFSKLKKKFIKQDKEDISADFLDDDYSEEDFLDDSEIKEISEIEKTEQRDKNKLKTATQDKLDFEEDKLENYEDIEETTTELDHEEELNDTLQNTLKSLGIEAEKIREVDIFSENEQRRTHPTLAAVRVKRIIQDQKIEDLGKEVILEEDKKLLADEIINKKASEVEQELLEKEVRISKHNKEREQLNQDFNSLERNEEKITAKNILKYTETSTDKAIDEIKAKELISSADNKNYDIKITENDKVKERREKLKHTTVDEVLEGSEELFENDIDNVAKKLNSSSQEKEIVSEDVEKFREDALKTKTSKDLVYDKNHVTELDNLIVETKIVEKAQEEELEEIAKLEENLELIKKDKVNKNSDIEDNEEISIEQVAKDSEIEYPEYEELKEPEITNPNILDGYSDYHLDIEEIEELTVKNKIDCKSEKTDIESLTKELTPKKEKTFNNDIDKFKEEKTYTPIKNIQEESKVEFKDNKEMIKNFEEAKPEGIEYTEKLYTNDVNEFFVDDNAPLTFGEYKTQDRGYRPVSKETIESNKKKLDAIFEKYSNVTIPRKNTTTYVEQKLSEDKPRNIGKFKPSPVYSSIYGAVDNNSKKNNSIEQKNVSKEKKPSSKGKKTNKSNKNYFKEIANQEETVWNIDLGNRANKKK